MQRLQQTDVNCLLKCPGNFVITAAIYSNHVHDDDGGGDGADKKNVSRRFEYIVLNQSCTIDLCFWVCAIAYA